MDIGVIGAGAMGSAIAGRLVEGGAHVLTYVEGRSAETVERAKAVGMKAVGLDRLVEADIILSIVPPAEAIGVAELLSAALRRRGRTTTFIDCNAISPKTMAQVASVFGGDCGEVLDGSIIGAPPKSGQKGPKLYVSGDAANRSGMLADHGLQVRRIDGGIGASSALKMCYAGINKGVTGLGTAMLLAAIRSGADEGLKRELQESQSDLDRKFAQSIPDMYPKAYRWVAEMEEIAEFLGEDDPAALIFRGMAGLYRKMAEDREAGGVLAGELDRLNVGA
ncbi:NAD(P)-dependent oxidoreductase [Agrobacterium rhizogenes]|uniref:6-phosphogluconate dehydrogenase n=1 Tax=Rhizobium rhizogenes NBRC 13257 TaxID=1220581 RepID=A0AA87Q1J8_RHIRH|nr:NAD(P)-dependent oxidoreductase [Rhizobium rhizogenes]OCJ30855.1 6-phosphogluconate dehydrogenase [Agrobacterium sp. B133/95]NTF55578.1 NAD(P)-dependent oxidoreductase [Rhizobium rhizogenes]NTF61937.1 NAD(P)-dependent oxidoreductase [Rhizobium rhizogenes]NTF75158.1 NAD(P)-dependent oxidoreductase [Rhizobium rhizogenes]NTF94187.1 NAD(P)-dependent oxidoreductase [Rhizobium rhizogenes]